MVSFAHGNVTIKKDIPFSLQKTFECGQCFRFENEDGIFTGVALGKKLRAYEKDDVVVLENVTRSEYETVWAAYFDMHRDYAAVNAALGRRCPVTAKAVECAAGIRLLCQDPWETLCSFILSQNNNIPRIKGIIKRLCENFGEEIGGGRAFPGAKALALAGADVIQSTTRCGFRAGYIHDAAQKVAAGEFDLAAVKNMNYADARAYLMTLRGVGPKVADCVLLYGYAFFDAFPKDVWIKRVIDKYFGDDFDEKRFAPYGGIAQQYLFYFERENVKKKGEKRPKEILCKKPVLKREKTG